MLRRTRRDDLAALFNGEATVTSMMTWMILTISTAAARADRRSPNPLNALAHFSHVT